MAANSEPAPGYSSEDVIFTRIDSITTAKETRKGREMTLVVLLGSILGEVVRSNPGGLCDERCRVTEFGPRLNSSLIRGRQQATVSV
jgi:hypothetical protein